LENARPESRDSLLESAISDQSFRLDDLNYNFVDSMEDDFKVSSPVWQPMLLASLFLLLSFSAAMGYRSHILQKERQQIASQTKSEFTTLFPNRRINGSIESLLETELKKQEQINSLISHTETSARLLVTLKRFLKGTPTNLPFQFESIDLQEQRIKVAGRVKGWDEFEKLKEGYINQGFSIGPDSQFGTPFRLVLIADQSPMTGEGEIQVTEVSR
jgi:type II secretory pathway component PulL